VRTGRGQGSGSRQGGGRGRGAGNGGRGQGGAHNTGVRRRGGSGIDLRICTTPSPAVGAGPDAETLDSSSRTAPIAAAPRVSAAPARPVVRVADAAACTLCGSCVDACMRDAISLNETAVIDARLCTTCGDCVAACPQDVLELVEA
jgi:ferredoxin